jgi:TRAP-type mannitol/chloroaromatic compound transport system permease small subunit
MKKLISIIEAISLLSGRIAALLLIPLTFAMVYEVISRYVFDAPTSWAFEISYMLMGSIFVLGLPYCLRNNAHVNVDFAQNHLPLRVVACIEIVAYCAMTMLLFWLTLALADSVVRAVRTWEGSGLSAWNPLVWPFRLVYTAGFALFGLQMFGKVLEAILKVLGGSPPAHPEVTIDEKAGAA